MNELQMKMVLVLLLLDSCYTPKEFEEIGVSKEDIEILCDKAVILLGENYSPTEDIKIYIQEFLK